MKVLSKPSKAQVLAAMIVLSVVTSLLGQRAGQTMRNLVQPLLWLGRAPHYLATSLRANASAVGRKPLSPQAVEELAGENQSLRGQVAYWRGEAERSDRQARSLLKFQETYGPSKDLPCDLIPARVIGESALPYDLTRRVNVGGSQNVTSGSLVLLTDRSKALPSGLAAVTDSALAGRIIAAGAFTAQLQVVTDKQFDIAARILRLVDPNAPREVRSTRQGSAVSTLLTEQNNEPLDGQAVGNGQGGLTIKDIWRHANVLPGDLVVTHDTRFLPLEVRIGRVSQVQVDTMSPDRVTVTVRPDFDASLATEVFVVLPLKVDGPSGSKAGK
ncbi:MAG: rod shape-determining protein MreC [Phycisphaerae bacterium]|jgi:cell shape-determining protein MreC